MFLFFLVGTLFSAIGLYFVLDAYTFRKKARNVPGQVVGYETSYSKNGWMYHPVVEYTEDGDTYRFKAEIGSSAMTYALHEDVQVLILGNRHSSARLKRPARPIFGFSFFLFGLVFVAIGAYGLGNLATMLLVSFLLQLGGVYLISHLVARHRQRQEEKYDYFKDEEGALGYKVSDDFIASAQSVQKHSVSRTVYVISTIVGVLMIAGSLYWADHQRSFIDTAIRVTGKIVDSESRYSDGTTVYAAVVLFEPIQNEHPIRFTSNVSSSNPSWRVGDSVDVLYDPLNNHDAMIDNGWMNYIVQIVILFIGLIVFIFSIKNAFGKQLTQ